MMSTKWLIIFSVVSAIFAISDGTGFSYNYLDEMAQTYCQGRFIPGWVFVLRRDCTRHAPTCKDMCAAAKDDILGVIGNQRTQVDCFDAIHIIKSHTQLEMNPTATQPDAGKVSLGTYGYGPGGCTWEANHCGPNYCCCKAF